MDAPKDVSTTEEKQQEDKVRELREAIGLQEGRAMQFCTDACLRRYLRARHWNVKKAEKMLRDSLKWREAFQPESIRWEDVEVEAETGKIYRTNFHDKKGRSVLVLAPGRQNTTGHEGQMKHLVYCLENAILNLPEDQEQMVWLIDYGGWSLRNSPPMKTSLETLNILQNHYPERLAAAILYKPPYLFQAFWKIIRPFIDPITFHKIKFVYEHNEASKKFLLDMFDLEQLDTAFGGKCSWEYKHAEYSEMMKKDDVRYRALWGVEGE